MILKESETLRKTVVVGWFSTMQVANSAEGVSYLGQQNKGVVGCLSVEVLKNSDNVHFSLKIAQIGQSWICGFVFYHDSLIAD